MNNVDDKIEIYFDNEYLVTGLNNMGAIKDPKLRATLKYLSDLKCLIYCLSFAAPLVFITTVIIGMEKLMIVFYTILFALFLILNILFIKYSIWGKVPIRQKSGMPYIDLVIVNKHYGYQDVKSIPNKISSDELVSVLCHYIKLHLVLFNFVYICHLIIVTLFIYTKSQLNVALFIAAVVLGFSLYRILLEILRVISDLFLFKKTFKL